MAIEHPESVGLVAFSTSSASRTSTERTAPRANPARFSISGPGLAAGHWRDDTQTRANFADGWLRTGDVAERDENGLLRVVGRIKDVIISGGMNIYVAELERVIMEFDAVLEVAVIGVADESTAKRLPCRCARPRRSPHNTWSTIVEHGSPTT